MEREKETQHEPLMLRCPKCGREAEVWEWPLAIVGSQSRGLRCPDCWQGGYAAIPETIRPD